MCLVTLGRAEEPGGAGIAGNSLWPRTIIATVADAAYAIVVRDPAECTGNFFVDDEVFTGAGGIVLERYRVDLDGGGLVQDLFLGSAH